MKSFSDLEQSKALSRILPLESADMVLPFRHPKNDEYIPGYAVSRSYIEVYNEMIKLPGMEKEDVCKLIQPVWSLAALLDFLKDKIVFGGNSPEGWFCCYTIKNPTKLLTIDGDSLVDACVAMIEKLHELNLL